MINLLYVNNLKSMKLLFISIAITVIGGSISAYFSMQVKESYQLLNQPLFAPPSWIFGPVWTLLYVLMGIAAYRVFLYGAEFRNVKIALMVYLVQLVLNFMWTPIFFRFELRGWAFVEILILLLFIICTTILFYKIDKLSGYLMIPYIIWVSFASILNYSIWRLNR